MFGYIKPKVSELRVREYELYRAVYCGLCAALGKNATCVGRLSLSYDFVFLAAVRMSLTKETGKIKKKRCIAHPTKKRAVLCDAPSLDYCAKLSASLTYHKLKDDINDSKGAKKLSAYMLLPFASLMRKKAKLDPTADKLICKHLSELSALEKEGCDSFDRAAEPFGELMAEASSHGFTEGSAEHRIASEIGRHIGRFIYITDAIDDLESDIKNGSYNPFIMMYGDPQKEIAQDRERIKTALTMELAGASRAAELISFDTVFEYGEIIKNILYLGLPELRDKILDKYSASAVNGENK